MLNVPIIIGSTRPGRKAEDVARWVYGIAAKRSDASFELLYASAERAIETVSPITATHTPLQGRYYKLKDGGDFLLVVSQGTAKTSSFNLTAGHWSIVLTFP